MSKLDVAKLVEGTGVEPKPLATFLDGTPSLTAEEKTLIIDQARTLMEDLYVHLPLKRAMYATDPVQRLKLLRHRLPQDRVFHEEMIDIFMSVRDLHTNYVLPDPYRRATAVLPFQIGEYFDQQKRRYIVFSTAGEDADFRPGMPITHWNGVPIERAVELNARRQAGGNEAAKHARGLQRMCVRPLMMSLPPDEDWVDVRYLDQTGTARERRFSWVVLQQPSATGASPEGSAQLASREAMIQFGALGLDFENEVANEIIKQVFQQEQVKIEADVLAYLQGAELESIAGADDVDFSKVSKMPEAFTFETVNTPDGAVGRIAIRTFAVNDPASFVREFVRIAALLPQNGLIVDVRNNGGGNIIAGETLLQTLTGRTIEPERLHFINTPLTLAIARSMPDWFSKWIPSMTTAVETGAVFSQGWPLLDVAEYNKIGRRYPGPVVLITNAFCYSTTDIFAAGFQDHKIGKIIGTDANTGAGGANVFDWNLMKTLGAALPNNPIATPPRGSSFRVAIRRTTRVGDNSGLALEDAGVVPDVIHRLTLEDLTNKDAALFARAAKLLKS